MEYSPNCDIPYVSRVDAGTIDSIRSHGVEIVSSGNLVQRFESIWNKKSLNTHLLASERLYKIKDQAFAIIRESISNKKTVSEFEIQQMMVRWFAEEGLISDSPPVVASQASSGNPHYLPTKMNTRLIRQNEIVLLDLWGKLDTPEAVFADITWVGYTASSVPSNIASVFRVVMDARDAAIDLVLNSTRSGRTLEGWEVDRVARTVVEKAGYGKHFVHRTGHSLGKNVHGNGVHMDDYETHDDRRLLPGTGFTIEPGIYFDNFGVRTEVNMYVGSEEALVTGPLQKDLVKLVS
jgi:Xaa-Pro aminopeptidase